jgi:RNA polymerase sigma-70 factor (ECF subfamily)
VEDTYRAMTDHDRLVALFERHHLAVLGYLGRRAASPHEAADAFSEVFLVAWRRLDDVPAGDAARLWLYGVGRRVLANQRRSARRRSQLIDRLAATLPATAFVAPAGTWSDLGRVRAALDRLPGADAELLLLTAWEGLSAAQAATVLGINPTTARVRLHRARARLRALLPDPVDQEV